MLIRPTDQESYRRISARWQALDSWLSDAANVSGALRAEGTIAPYRDAWRSVDRSLLTNPDELPGALQQLVEAESAARPFGYSAVDRTAGGFLDSVLPDAVNPFAPSDDVKQAVADAAAAWATLEQQMLPNPKVTAAVMPQYDHWLTFWQAWQAGDRNIPAVNSIVEDVNVARRNAADALAGKVVSDQSNDTGTLKGVDIERSSATLATGAAAEDYCRKHPKDLLCAATSPDTDESLCQRAGISDLICDKSGIKSWFWWALGLTGAATLGGVVYVSYKASKAIAPLALAYYAPEALPAYQALQRGDQEATQQHALELARQAGAAQSAAASARPPAASAPPTLASARPPAASAPPTLASASARSTAPVSASTRTTVALAPARVNALAPARQHTRIDSPARGPVARGTRRSS